MVWNVWWMLFLIILILLIIQGDFTARSPEMLAPARMPVAAGKKMAKTEKNVSSRKSGPMFSHMIEPDGKEEI